MIVTEHGVADLQGRSPADRADRPDPRGVAHPGYRPALLFYRERVDGHGGHAPHDPETVLAWPRDRQRERGRD